MLRRSVAVLLFVMAYWQAALADEDPKWICVAEAATGFKYQGGRWVTTNFNVENNRYLVVKKPWLGMSKTYQVVLLGEEYGTRCNENSPTEYGWMYCEDYGQKFHINIKTLRYLSVFLVGYAFEGADEDGATPYIESGTCSPL